MIFNQPPKTHDAGFDMYLSPSLNDLCTMKVEIMPSTTCTDAPISYVIENKSETLGTIYWNALLSFKSQVGLSNSACVNACGADELLFL